MIDKAHIPVLLERLVALLGVDHLGKEVGQATDDFAIDHLELELAFHAVFVWLRDP